MNNKREQVFQLFMEKLSGSISPEDEVVLHEMLSADPALGALWHSLEGEAAGLDVNELLSRTDAAAELSKLKMVMGTRPGAVKKGFPYKKVFSVAAIFLIAIAGAWLIFFKKPVLVNKEQISAAVRKNRSSVSLQLGNGQTVDLGDSGAGRPIALSNATLKAGKGALEYTSEDTTENVLSVPAGGNYKIVLSDGTQVQLNAATRLRFPFRFGRATRDVYLEGEAYFKVAGDARRPFIVHTALTKINVLGTSFNVNSYEEGSVRTSLVEGKVITKANDGSAVELSPGYAAEYRSAKGFSSGKFDEEDDLSWINGIYYFHDMPVAILTHLASRCYGIHIVIDEEKFAGKSVTGLLDRNKLSDFLADLESTVHLKYHYSGNNLYLE